MSKRSTTRTFAAVAAAAVSLASVTGAALAAPGTHRSSVDHVSLAIKSDTQRARKGPDGKWHDAYLPAAFSARAGDTVVVTVRNYDNAVHTFSALKLGVNKVVKAGSATHPSVTTITFRAPKKAGTYFWQCLGGCDAWAMSHVGFMKGVITVRA